MKQTKLEIRKNKLTQHYNALQSLATICGVNNPDGKKLSLQLLKIEKATYKIVLDYCNGENGIDTDNWQSKVEPFRQEVKKIFNNNLQGFYINADARGCALKINDTQFRELYRDTNLTQDWGGNGLLSPDIE